MGTGAGVAADRPTPSPGRSLEKEEPHPFRLGP